MYYKTIRIIKYIVMALILLAMYTLVVVAL